MILRLGILRVQLQLQDFEVKYSEYSRGTMMKEASLATPEICEKSLHESRLIQQTITERNASLLTEYFGIAGSTQYYCVVLVFLHESKNPAIYPPYARCKSWQRSRSPVSSVGPQTSSPNAPPALELPLLPLRSLSFIHFSSEHLVCTCHCPPSPMDPLPESNMGLSRRFNGNDEHIHKTEKDPTEEREREVRPVQGT
jgi:hypothetical protein